MRQGLPQGTARSLRATLIRQSFQPISAISAKMQAFWIQTHALQYRPWSGIPPILVDFLDSDVTN